MKYLKKFNEGFFDDIGRWMIGTRNYDYITRETDVPTGKGGYYTKDELEKIRLRRKKERERWNAEEDSCDHCQRDYDDENDYEDEEDYHPQNLGKLPDNL